VFNDEVLKSKNVTFLPYTEFQP